MSKRILSLMLIVTLFIIISVPVTAQTTGSCFLRAPADAAESTTFILEVVCDGVTATGTDDGLDGFDVGTSVVSTDVSTVATAYTFGNMIVDSEPDGIPDNGLLAFNTLPQFVFTLQNPASPATGNLVLGTVEYTVGSLGANTTATFTFDTAIFGDKLGSSLNLLAANPDATINLINLISASFNVNTDASVTKLRNADVVAGAVESNPVGPVEVQAANLAQTFDFPNAFNPLDGTVAVTVSAQSHLTCTGNLDISGGADINQNTVLLAGDVDNDDMIDLADSAAIGLLFGDTGVTTAEDVNGDEDIDILDLIHVGRNFEAHLTNSADYCLS